MPIRVALSAYAGPIPRLVVPICRLPSRRSRCTVERHVPRHDQVRVAGEEDEPAGRRGRASRGRRAPRSRHLGSTTQPAPIAHALPAMMPDGTAGSCTSRRRRRSCALRWGRPGSGRRGRSPRRAGRRSCPCPRRPTAHRRSRWRARGPVLHRRPAHGRQPTPKAPAAAFAARFPPHVVRERIIRDP